MGGTVALRFFDHGANYDCGELDIYLPNSLGAYEMHWHLIKIQGYKYTSRWPPATVFGSDDAQPFLYVEKRIYAGSSAGARPARTIQVCSLDFRSSGAAALMLYRSWSRLWLGALES